MKYHARSMSGGIEWKRIYCNIVQYVDTSLKTTWLWKSTLKQCITTAVIDVTSVIMSAKPAWQYIMKLHSKNVNQCDQCEYVPTTGSDLNNHMTCRGRSMPGEVGWKRIYCHTLRVRLGGCGKESFCPKIDKCVNSVVTSLKTTCLWKSTLKWCITMAFIHVTSVTRFEKPTWPYNNTL